MVTEGLPRARPAMMTTPMQMTNAIVGTMKTRADSATPHRFRPVITASVARHSHILAP
jgi:hypothetical protein